MIFETALNISTYNMLLALNKKGVRLIYGGGNFPVPISFNDEVYEIPNSWKTSIAKIHRDVYDNFNQRL